MQKRTPFNFRKQPLVNSVKAPEPIDLFADLPESGSSSATNVIQDQTGMR